MKNVLRIVALVAISVTSFAQITLTQANVPSVGETSGSYSASAVTFDPSATGGNANWNITSYNFSDDEYNSTYVTPSSTPFAAEFPTANIATAQGVDPDISYTYFRSAGNGLYLLGIATNAGGSETILVPDNEVLVIPFPMTMGTGWSSVYRLTYEAVPGFSVTNVDSSRIEIQAWGTMTTPLWTESCLKALNHSFNASYLNGQQQGPTTERWSYAWFTLNPSRTVDFDNQSATGPNYTNGELTYSVSGTTHTPSQRGPVAESFKLSQNYPNPFNPTTNLPVELAKSAKVDVTIYNEMGQVVQSMNFDLSAGQHDLPIDGSAWSTGNYFAKVTAGSEAQTTRMVLVK
jgi:hypothetical protein